MLISEETDELLYNLHQKISDVSLSEKEMAQHACFIAGTLVHTDKGLAPINKIKVGDRVLSRDENNPDAEKIADDFRYRGGNGGRRYYFSIGKITVFLHFYRRIVWFQLIDTLRSGHYCKMLL